MTSTSVAETSPHISKKMRLRVLGGSLSGSTIEWFEFFLYASAAALIFDKQFFPSSDPFVSLMLSYLSLSLTFFIRPLGGILFSHLGDRIGRKKTLVITLVLMGAATVSVGLLPNYAAIGVWAPILLITCRLVQGLAISGEWGGALLLAYEYAPRNKRGFFGSVPQMGVALGMVLSTLSMAGLSLLPAEAFNAWGWRIPFVASILLVFLGLWLRSGVDETPAFRKTKEAGKTLKLPIATVLRHHWRAVLVAVGAKVVETAPFYIFATFIVSYGTGSLGFDRTTVLLAVSIAAFVAAFTIPLAGSLSDGRGRKVIFMIGAGAMGLFAFPYFLLINLGMTWSLILATVIAVGLLWPVITATYGTMTSEIFSPEIRYTGITLGQQVGAAAAGGTAPLLATFLLHQSGNSWVPIASYVVVCAAISLFSVAYIRRAAAADTDLALDSVGNDK